ncbi:MAG: UDP-2,3-diacylglucosamine diphosphatase LpxI [Rhodospirillales bacterium]|nr:UDP-2,3-diacylglucosamine diphosphatase LpxI [Rhodospirillales bacterium]
MKTSTSDSYKTLGIIAGGGILPDRLLAACDKRGIQTFVIGFEGHTDRDIMAGRQHLWTRVGAVGQIIQTLKAHHIRDLIMIGSVSRPSLSELKPDWKTAAFLMKIGMRSLTLGDDGLLSAIRQELENEGFVLHSVQEFAEDLLAPAGAIGKYAPMKADKEDIDRGLEVAKALGALDVGQAVVIQEGLVLGVEAIEGTDALINRCGELKRGGRGPILVKLCKPQQDMSLDLPTIGPTTLDHAAFRGFRGIIFAAHKTLLIDPQRVAEHADSAKMFVYGIEI